MTGIFRQSSVDSISSPEQLHDYIRVSNPSVWVVLSAVMVLIISLLVWGIFGAMPTVIKSNAVFQGDNLVCFIPKEEMKTDIVPGLKVIVEGMEEGIIKSISNQPISINEIKEKYGNYASGNLILSQWNVEVIIDSEGSYVEGTIYPLSIVTEETRPIDFLIN